MQLTSDEVNLHSRFICELLNQHGNHGYNTRLASEFLKLIGIMNFPLDENFKVQREFKNIDIFITNKHQAIIIGNKIWAKDQDKQLERYFTVVEEMGYTEITVFYLTLQGTEPSENSVGNLAIPINLISYSHDISKWIETCIQIAAEQPTLRETLVQYQNTINYLTGKTMTQEETTEIIELLSENDNIISAHKIFENWIHIKWRTEHDFWQDLSNEINKNHSILEYQKYSGDRLDNVIHQSRNRNTWYGLMFKILEYNNCDVCCYIERGWGDLYYGLTILKNNDRFITDDEKFSELAKAVNPLCEWERESQWLGGNWIVPRINFESFSTENTLKLRNNEFRHKTIIGISEQINTFIQKSKDIISQLDKK